MSINFNDLTGGRLVNLIEISDNFLDDMWEYSKDERLYEYFEFKCHKSKEETKKYLEKLLQRHSTPESFYWFIKDKLSSKVIGSIGINKIDSRKMSCEIGYALSPMYWGKGFFHDALSIVVKDLFLEKKFNRIQAFTFITNQKSIKALKRIGFKAEGEIRDYYRMSNLNYVNAQLLSILNKDYVNIAN